MLQRFLIILLPVGCELALCLGWMIPWSVVDAEQLSASCRNGRQAAETQSVCFRKSDKAAFKIKVFETGDLQRHPENTLCSRYKQCEHFSLEWKKSKNVVRMYLTINVYSIHGVCSIDSVLIVYDTLLVRKWGKRTLVHFEMIQQNMMAFFRLT